MLKEKTLNFFSYLFIFFPIFLISGPLIPDLYVVLSTFLFFLVLNKFDNRLFKNKILIIFVLLWLIFIISSLFSEAPPSHSLAAKLYIPGNFNISENLNAKLFSLKSSLFYFRFIIFSLMIYLFLNRDFNITKKLYFLLISVFLFLFIDSIFQKIFGFNLLGMKQPSEVIRIGSIFGDELILGSYIVKFYPLLIGLTFFFHSKKFLRLFLIFSLISFIIVLLSAEKKATVIFFIEFFAILIFVKMKLRNKLILFFTPIILINFIFIIFPDIKLRLVTQLLQNSHNFKFIFTQVHNEHYISSMKIYKDNKLIGIGPKMFRNYCHLDKYRVSENSCSTHPHNYSMQLLAETGTISLLIFLIINFIFLNDFIRSIIKKKYGKYDFLLYNIIILNLINFMPLFPSGNFFNNWISMNNFLPLGFYFFLKTKNDLNNDQINFN